MAGTVDFNPKIAADVLHCVSIGRINTPLSSRVSTDADTDRVVKNSIEDRDVAAN
ncbi:MAG: hypothetical protein ACJAUP_000911 [Cellvibrionaceae bacterium]|jgi:hypothetical protein